MQVSRQDLLQICDKFLEDKIGKREVQDYAWTLITSNDHEWGDDVIAETLYEWDNEQINFPINKVNMQLCFLECLYIGRFIACTAILDVVIKG